MNTASCGCVMHAAIGRNHNSKGNRRLKSLLLSLFRNHAAQRQRTRSLSRLLHSERNCTELICIRRPVHNKNLKLESVLRHEKLYMSYSLMMHFYGEKNWIINRRREILKSCYRVQSTVKRCCMRKVRYNADLEVDISA